MGQKDPYASSGLGDVISEILWGKTYVASFLRKYPEVFNTRCNSDASTTANESAIKTAKTAKYCLDNPLKFFLQTEGPDKDPTWLQALPNEALRLAIKHCNEVAQGFYKPEITGALKQPKGEQYNVERFHKGARVSKRFFEPFQIAYGSHRGIVQGSLRGKTSRHGNGGCNSGRRHRDRRGGGLRGHAARD